MARGVTAEGCQSTMLTPHSAAIPTARMAQWAQIGSVGIARGQFLVVNTIERLCLDRREQRDATGQASRLEQVQRTEHGHCVFGIAAFLSKRYCRIVAVLGLERAKVYASTCSSPCPPFTTFCVRKVTSFFNFFFTIPKLPLVDQPQEGGTLY